MLGIGILCIDGSFSLEIEANEILEEKKEAEKPPPSGIDKFLGMFGKKEKVNSCICNVHSHTQLSLPISNVCFRQAQPQEQRLSWRKIQRCSNMPRLLQNSQRFGRVCLSISIQVRFFLFFDPKNTLSLIFNTQVGEPGVSGKSVRTQGRY